MLFVGAGKGSDSDLDCLIFFDILTEEMASRQRFPNEGCNNALEISTTKNITELNETMENCRNFEFL